MHFGFGAVRVVGLDWLDHEFAAFGRKAARQHVVQQLFSGHKRLQNAKGGRQRSAGRGASESAAMDARAPPRLKCMLETLLTADCVVLASRLTGTSRAVFCMQTILYHIRSQ